MTSARAVFSRTSGEINTTPDVCRTLARHLRPRSLCPSPTHAAPSRVSRAACVTGPRLVGHTSGGRRCVQNFPPRGLRARGESSARCAADAHASSTSLWAASGQTARRGADPTTRPPLCAGANTPPGAAGWPQLSAPSGIRRSSGAHCAVRPASDTAHSHLGTAYSTAGTGLHHRHIPPQHGWGVINSLEADAKKPKPVKFHKSGRINDISIDGIKTHKVPRWMRVNG